MTRYKYISSGNALYFHHPKTAVQTSFLFMFIGYLFTGLVLSLYLHVVKYSYNPYNKVAGITILLLVIVAWLVEYYEKIRHRI